MRILLIDSAPASFAYKADHKKRKKVAVKQIFDKSGHIGKN